MHTATQAAGVSPRARLPFLWVFRLLNIIICICAVIVLLWFFWGSYGPMDLRARGRYL